MLNGKQKRKEKRKNRDSRGNRGYGNVKSNKQKKKQKKQPQNKQPQTHQKIQQIKSKNNQMPKERLKLKLRDSRLLKQKRQRKRRRKTRRKTSQSTHPNSLSRFWKKEQARQFPKVAKLTHITLALFSMVPNSIRAEIEASHLCSQLALVRSSSVGMKDSSKCAQARKLFSTAHQTMPMEREQWAKSHPTRLCSSMSKSLVSSEFRQFL